MTPFQQVVVVNAPSSPIPVVGTVNVGNTPANQNVTVSNFPATQAVNGAVTIAPATKFFGTGLLHLHDSGGNTAKEFGQTINVTSIGLADTDGIDPFSDSIEVLLLPPSGVPFVPVHIADGSAFITFTQPIPATQINFACLNDAFDCDFYATVVGY